MQSETLLWLKSFGFVFLLLVSAIVFQLSRIADALRQKRSVN